MSRDTSLQEIDILKLIMFVLAFLLVCVAFIVLLIIPSIKEYKKLKIANHSTLLNLARIEQIYNTNADALSQFKLHNQRTLMAISNDFNKEDFLKNASKYFKSAQLNAIESEDNNASFIQYELSVQGTLSNPNNFYDFIDFINEYDNIILVEFPIQMRTKGDEIDANFNIKVFEVKVKN